MPIPVTCLSCGAKMKAPDNMAGKKSKCPKCGAVVAVPTGTPAGPELPPQQPEAAIPPSSSEPTYALKDEPIFNPPAPRADRQEKSAPWAQDEEQFAPTPSSPKASRKATVRPPATDDDREEDERTGRRPVVVVVPQSGRTDAPGVISLIFGCLSVVCLLLGCFTCGITYWAAVPFAAIGAVVAFFGQGNMRVAGLVLNFLALIPAIILLATFAGMVGLAGLGAAVQPSQTDRTPAPWPAAPDREKESEPKWTPSDKAVVHGDLQIQITKTAIGKVPLKEIFHEGATSQDDLLMVTLALLNKNPTKKVEYHSWAGKDISFDRDYATLADNFENTYKRIGFGISSYPIGAVERSVSIYPNKVVTDVLVFQVPLDNATYLDLELPAKNFDSEGMIRFRIPMKKVENSPASRRMEQEETEAARKAEQERQRREQKAADELQRLEEKAAAERLQREQKEIEERQRREFREAEAARAKLEEEAKRQTEERLKWVAQNAPQLLQEGKQLVEEGKTAKAKGRYQDATNVLQKAKDRLAELIGAVPQSDTATEARRFLETANNLQRDLKDLREAEIAEAEAAARKANAEAISAAERAKEEEDANRKLNLVKDMLDDIKSAKLRGDGQEYTSLREKVRTRCEEIVKNYPKTKAAADAKKQLEKLP
jgi:hypothetical protein